MTFQLCHLYFGKALSTIYNLFILIKSFLFIIGISFTYLSFAQDTLTVYFLHGSKPKKACKTEQNWFGGKLGGHVGISINNSKILNFLPTNGASAFNKKEIQSKFILSTETAFWNILGVVDSVTSTVIKIPITASDKDIYNRIKKNYMDISPYSYAFFGYRCASATYDILSQLGIVQRLSDKKTVYKIFYPKKLRKLLTKRSHYKIQTKEGTIKRKWER